MVVSMMLVMVVLAAAAVGFARASELPVTPGIPLRYPCEVRAWTNNGAVCGLLRRTPDGGQYASFQGIPYVAQPLGERRFQELPPHEPWLELDATAPGPRCPQHDALFPGDGTYAEDCLRANVYIPLRPLPETDEATTLHILPTPEDRGLPILVFIHGGGFAFGSGNPDLYGPELFMKKNIIVITFNYRLNVFGFLSLQSRSVPGNAGLRDMVALLHWVRENARQFGGNPREVTIAGQSAGAAAVHLLTLAPSTEGLFNRGIMMSGTGVRSFFSSTPAYAATVAKALVDGLGINSTDPEVIHEQLISMPLENIMLVNRQIQDQIGVGAFYPTVETQYEGITTIIDDDPEMLLKSGRGRHVPLLIGYTANECSIFRKVFDDVDLMDKLEKNPALMLPPQVLMTTPPAQYGSKLARVLERYQQDGKAPSLDDFIHYCTDALFKYPAHYAAHQRLNVTNNAVVYLYQFSYVGQHRVFEDVLGVKLGDAAHVEDLTYIFTNTYGNKEKNPHQYLQDLHMQQWMTSIFANFILYTQPPWQYVEPEFFEYQNIRRPGVQDMSPLTEQDISRTHFYDKLYESDTPATAAP